jgi:hypothetical protein
VTDSMPKLDQRLSLASTSDEAVWRWVYRAGLAAGTMRLLVLIAAFAASMSPGFAGPCSRAVDRMQARIDARLEVAAGRGPTAPVSSGAYLHRQPTPRSLAAAESRLGEVSPQTIEAVRAAMVRAREADRAGDKRGCTRALSNARQAMGH